MLRQLRHWLFVKTPNWVVATLWVIGIVTGYLMMAWGISELVNIILP